MLEPLIAGLLTRAWLLVPSDMLCSQMVEKCIELKKSREKGVASPTEFNPGGADDRLSLVGRPMDHKGKSLIRKGCNLNNQRNMDHAK
ncbi:hypothetical protein [Pseudomonas sp. 25 R 14]|uniref:hypothetical protein n=1 Tax=Pseudomonas sp. 25 R 14 TaxID=1844109 RepID=UPI0008125579|nr:hypothetical protein [Pseudomonas sp. 25 R 14]CRM47044.1 hypothetical protein [Pseudomonas sp. 25 R 14]